MFFSIWLNQRIRDHLHGLGNLDPFSNVVQGDEKIKKNLLFATLILILMHFYLFHFFQGGGRFCPETENRLAWKNARDFIFRPAEEAGPDIYQWQWYHEEMWKYVFSSSPTTTTTPRTRTCTQLSRCIHHDISIIIFFFSHVPLTSNTSKCCIP